MYLKKFIKFMIQKNLHETLFDCVVDGYKKQNDKNHD